MPIERPVTMKAADIDLARLLEFHPESGRLLFGGHRMVITSQRSLGLLTESLSRQLGFDFTRALFAQFGYACGCDDHEVITKGMAWDSAQDRWAAGPSLHAWKGFVQAEVTSVSQHDDGRETRMVGRWYNSFEAENYVRLFGPSTVPVCASLAGYASGWASRSASMPMLAIETQCVAMGDPHCAFEIRAETAWGEEADPWRYALKARHASVAQVLEDRVAERARALQELQRALDEHALVSTMSPQGIITYANERLCAMSQFSQDELVGRDFRVLGSGHHPPEFWDEFWATIQAGRVWRGEVCNRAKDGSFYWVDATVTPLLATDGKPIQYIAIRSDITERKRAEQELRLATAAADNANRAKSDFLAMMSHEIRTPMNAILGFAALLKESALSEEQHKFASIIHGSGQALLALINDILDFSKAEAGQMTLESLRYDLWALIDEVVTMLSVGGRAKGVTLLAERHPDVPQTLVGDPTRVRQVLLNLVGNALKFTEQGSVRIVSSVGPEGHVCIAVEDTGIGISPEGLGSLFRSFTQADRSTTRRYGGTGLGLAISKRLVEMMDGQIGVDSEAGRGSRFWFTLPVLEGSAAGTSATAPIPAPNAPGTPARCPAGLHALVAEDNELNQLLARRLLTDLGCLVDIAPNGCAAVEAWASGRYDVVFMDCHMPEMDGFEATREIRRRERALRDRRHTRIVALTASLAPDDWSACTDAGMDEFLAKPVSKGDFEQCLSTVTRDAPLERSA